MVVRWNFRHALDMEYCSSFSYFGKVKVYMSLYYFSYREDKVYYKTARQSEIFHLSKFDI